eukprot:3441130-Amphidinium_carterae.1
MCFPASPGKTHPDGMGCAAAPGTAWRRVGWASDPPGLTKEGQRRACPGLTRDNSPGTSSSFLSFSIWKISNATPGLAWEWVLSEQGQQFSILCLPGSEKSTIVRRVTRPAPGQRGSVQEPLPA